MSEERKYLENALDALFESLENNPELLREALEEEGYNYESLVAHGKSLAQTLRQECVIDEVKMKRERIEGVLNNIKTSLPTLADKEEILKFLNSLFPGSVGQPAYQALFRKLENDDIASLRGIADDAELLKVISGVFNNDGGQEM